MCSGSRVFRSISFQRSVSATSHWFRLPAHCVKESSKVKVERWSSLVTAILKYIYCTLHLKGLLREGIGEISEEHFHA